MQRMVKVHGVRGLYRDQNSQVYFHRVQSAGRNTYQSLGTSRRDQAIKNMEAKRLAAFAAEQGLEVEKPRRKPITVAMVIEKYRQGGYLDRNETPRPEGLHRFAEATSCDTLLTFFKETPVSDLKPKLLREYHAWRIQNVTRGEGHRTTDLELNTLSNALHWAVSEELLDDNPILRRKRFRRGKEIVHCREKSPEDIEELHTIATLLFKDPRSEVLGWQFLFESLTGLRNAEALLLRVDVKSDEAGGITADGKSLCVHHVKEGRHANPYVMIHDGLRQLIDAHRAWLKERHPESPFYFPGKGGNKVVSKGALTHRLAGLLKEGKLRKHFTSHGARAFYVTARRSQGASDAQIAWEINHVGGTGTLEAVYGGVPQHWRDGKGPNMSWIPKMPAWTAIKQKPGTPQTAHG